MSRAFTRCPCGHLFLHHDIEEHDGDGSDLCCVDGCDQVACPGRRNRDAPYTDEDHSCPDVRAETEEAIRSVR